MLKHSFTTDILIGCSTYSTYWFRHPSRCWFSHQLEPSWTRASTLTALHRHHHRHKRHDQCDQMVGYFINIWPFVIVKISPIVPRIKSAKVGWTFCQILNEQSKISQSLLKFCTKWVNFTQSGHTGYDPNRYAQKRHEQKFYRKYSEIQIRDLQEKVIREWSLLMGYHMHGGL